MKGYYNIALRAYCYRVLDCIFMEHKLHDNEFWKFLRPSSVDQWRYANTSTGELLCKDIRILVDAIADYLCYDEARANILLAQVFWEMENSYTSHVMTDESLSIATVLPPHPNTAKLAYCYLIAKDYIPDHETTDNVQSENMFNKYVIDITERAQNDPIFRT